MVIFCNKSKQNGVATESCAAITYNIHSSGMEFVKIKKNIFEKYHMSQVKFKMAVLGRNKVMEMNMVVNHIKSVV